MPVSHLGGVFLSVGYPLLRYLSANRPGKVLRDGLGIWISAARMGDLNDDLGLWLQDGPNIAVVFIWGMTQMMECLHLHFLLLCLSNKYNF